MVPILRYSPEAALSTLFSLFVWLARREWTAMRSKIDVVADNHLMHVQTDLARLCVQADEANTKADTQITILNDIAKGIAVLVDRGRD